MLHVAYCGVAQLGCQTATAFIANLFFPEPPLCLPRGLPQGPCAQEAERMPQLALALREDAPTCPARPLHGLASSRPPPVRATRVAHGEGTRRPGHAAPSVKFVMLFWI